MKRTAEELGTAWADWKIRAQEAAVEPLRDNDFHLFCHFMDRLPDPLTEAEFDAFKRTFKTFVEVNRK